VLLYSPLICGVSSFAGLDSRAQYQTTPLDHISEWTDKGKRGRPTYLQHENGKRYHSPTSLPWFVTTFWKTPSFSTGWRPGQKAWILSSKLVSGEGEGMMSVLSN